VGVPARHRGRRAARADRLGHDRRPHLPRRGRCR
jgi:hypothetical protein